MQYKNVEHILNKYLSNQEAIHYKILEILLFANIRPYYK